MKPLKPSLPIGLALTLLVAIAQPASAQRLSGAQAIDALADGGYVLVMRHAPASLQAAGGGGRGGGFGFGGGGRGGRGGGAPQAPAEETLEQSSIELLTGMRHAIWYFKIPVGAIYTSPTRRTTQHAEEIPFAEITIVDDLDSEAAGSGWLARKLTEAPMAGSNSIIVTHGPNIQADLDIAVAEGETLIVRPGANPEVVGRLGLREWSVLAIELGG